MAAIELDRDLWIYCYSPGNHGTVALQPPGLEFLLAAASPSERDAERRGSRRARSWKGSTAPEAPALVYFYAGCRYSKVRRLQPKSPLFVL